MGRLTTWCLTAGVVLALSACGRARQSDLDGPSCSNCHGSDLTPAPPNDLLGEADPLARGVGAHQAHVFASRLRGPVPCESCHVVPKTMDTPGHMDGWPAGVTFSGLALVQGASPELRVPQGTGKVRDDRWLLVTCAGSYCHGATLKGGLHTAPLWNQPDPKWTRCDACHGAPPPAPHPDNPRCERCHEGYTATTVNLAVHLNGVVDKPSLDCTSCHGDPARPATALNPRLAAAPPAGTRGETATTERAVGAHQAHLNEGPLSPAFSCAECHRVPEATDHADGTVQLEFGALATTGGAAPAWNGASCTSSYCHGNFKNGEASNAPAWTGKDQARCGSCHGTPPGGTHPESPQCGLCHPGYTATTVNLATHVNGQVEVANLTCSSCHGDATRPATALNPQLPAAPPQGTHGETSTQERAVGAHQAHLADGPLRGALACEECHAVPTRTTHSDGVVDLAFGSLARTGGAAPAWNGATCTSSYCHGNFQNGAHSNAPGWTAPNQAQCGSCHGLPPGGTHPSSNACGLCHPGYTATTVNLATHINGVVDLANLSCTSCHGDAARAATAVNPQLPAAPPQGTQGETSTTQRAVGAHQAHLNDGALRGAIRCDECHAVPSSNLHTNGQVELAFGALATTGNVTPAWNGATCTSSYCHGNFKNGATANAPSWTGANQAACGTCHGAPPGGTHPNASNCATCHAGYTASTVNLATHMNGVVEATATCTSCHGDGTRAATAKNPQLPAAPPLGTHGETATSARAVGAHQAHLNDGTLSLAFACTECHVVPTSIFHSNGTVAVTFGALAKTGGANPAWSGASCGSSYCHGATLTGGTLTTPTWTTVNGTQVACGTCHGISPNTGQHARHRNAQRDCYYCHGTGYTGTSSSKTVNATLHVDGVVQVGGTGTSINSYNRTTHSCSPSCHGNEVW